MSEQQIDYKRILRDGIWDNNIVFSQMLALCPLLAVTGTATNGLGLGLATLFVMVISNLVVALFRGIITPEVRIPIFILLIAGIVTLVDMMMNAWLHELHKVLGLFIPLIVTNCAILGRAEAFASREPIRASIVDGFAMGLGFLLSLVALGAVREILATGTLFSGAALLLGNHFHFMELTLIPDYRGFLLIALPPGGFIMMGFLMAAKRIYEKRQQEKVRQSKASGNTSGNTIGHAVTVEG
jgi:electron transport complex protein RnfE